MLFLDGPCEGFSTSYPGKVKDYWFIRSLDDLELLGTLDHCSFRRDSLYW